MAENASTSHHTEPAELKKSKKPANTAFKQQRLPAWQPVLTARTVIPALFVIGILFIPVGAVLYTQSLNVEEHIVDYTSGGSCKDCFDNLNTTSAHQTSYQPCKCDIRFQLDVKFKGVVLVYYGLKNFYQNHRRYVKSRDDTQLLGEKMSAGSLTKDCEPYRIDNATSNVIAPCGAIANSMFNDTLSLSYGTLEVPLIKKGIAWPTDKSAKFKNPTYGSNLCDAEAFKNTVKPPNWPKSICELDIEDPTNNGYQNEDFIVWMRNAALPNFRKLYRRVNHTVDVFKDGLPAGNYTLHVEYKYPVRAFDGRKLMILSTVNWLGGRNPFLGIAYMVVGVVCVLLSLAFIVIHFRVGKSDQDLNEVNSRTPYM